MAPLDWVKPWNASKALELSMNSCTQCNGMGSRAMERINSPCGCVFRTIFRKCFYKFLELRDQDRSVSKIQLEVISSMGRKPRGSLSWSRPHEEFIADFLIISRKALRDYPLERSIFNMHYLEGAFWNRCTEKLKLDRGAFFHSVYRLQQRLGRKYFETLPYALFPLDDYFYLKGNMAVVKKDGVNASSNDKLPFPRPKKTK